jgi:hypothetical protein
VTRTRMIRLRRVLPALCLAMTAGLAASACQPVQSGAAVIVGGERISVGDVQDRVTRIAEQRERTGQQMQQASALTKEQLQRLILTRILARAAQNAGVSVSQAEIDARRRALEEQGGVEAFNKLVAESNVLPDEVDHVLGDAILIEKIGEVLVPGAQTPEQQQERSLKQTEAVGRATKELGIKVNPRYGRWDPEENNVTPALGGFVKPEVDTSAPPAP